MPVPSASITAWRGAAAPRRSGARRAPRRWRRCPPSTGSPSRSAHQVARRARRRAAGARTTRHARLRLDQRGDPEAHAVDVGRGRAHLLDGLDDDVERLLRGRRRATVRCTRWWTTSSSSTTPPSSFVPPASMPMTRLAAWPDDIQGAMADSPSAARPNTRSTGHAASAAAGSARGGDSTACASAGAQAAANASRASRERRGITPGRVLKWVALGVVGLAAPRRSSSSWSAPRPRRACRDSAERALVERRQPADRQHDPRARLRRARRATRSTRARAAPRGPTRSCSCTPPSAACGKPLDPARHRRRHPWPRHAEDQRRLRARRAAADDRDRRGVHGQRPEINHLIEVDFKDFPKFIDALGGIT